ncbi:MAG: toll/interleukin-1 receptor domain-containing protein, partial [Candidatus Acidiferrales bacterium]
MARDMIFVSHANPEDNEFARWLSLRLANEGYPVWCDLTKLLGGETFWDDIQKAIKERTIKFLF